MRKANGKGNGSSGRLVNGVGSREAWNDQVARLMQQEGLAREKARDQVIMGELRLGHMGALAALLMEGHVPSPSIRFALALMLLENDEAEAAIDHQHADPASLWLPHRLVVKSRPAQPRRVREAGKDGEKTAARAGAVDGKLGPVMHDLGYEAAIARLDLAVLAADPGTLATPRKPDRQPTARPRRRK
ncbi:MAG TPA: hypothetical protein VKW08_05485 [Xanthobacteraceae bacterium]|jgi:hypothetical protein|nr:hypothetical protein [Xanthobacteraceae bacterium]